MFHGLAWRRSNLQMNLQTGEDIQSYHVPNTKKARLGLISLRITYSGISEMAAFLNFCKLECELVRNIEYFRMVQPQ
jgi:hypothetical protein